MVARLLGDGASPLYYARAPRSLQHTVRAARHALDPVFVVRGGSEPPRRVAATHDFDTKETNHLASYLLAC